MIDQSQLQLQGLKRADRTEKPVPELLYLNRETIAWLGGDSSWLYTEAMEEALSLHARGDYVQPLKPYLRSAGEKGHIADRIIAMPASIGGDFPLSGLKWIGSKHDNPQKRGKERASGVIILNDAASHFPIAVLEAGLISSMRTAAVTVVAAKHLARAGFRTITCVGCGLIAHAQLNSLLEQFDHVQEVYLFDQSLPAAERLAGQLHAKFPDVTFTTARSAEQAVREGELVVTCTVTDTPYIPFEWIRKGAFISNISIMDVHKEVYLQADKVIVDDWDQSNREKKVLNQLVLEGKFSREQLYAELGEIVIGAKSGRQNEEEIIILNPMGMAIEDIACARLIYLLACKEEVGLKLPLY
ncbi:2,3-diaminopropionate biosynthesis protein SbnB [Paenibacillus sp. HWE-109]|uniref:2,3-diaminopropionate biosynthesis protein SbnB n=1 Tax=Paenibacillus sp. HWE-109 TaxID=1306526 RepID=UPI001EDDAAEB|nr:2,3-diaminopropionate biosynthesis protein SbnB [Paenibacillus sp. HWE-109]UKS28457.1 2,3-diaminopropionate biosynthesis protein SbnB [Paenibacillus sp. HWE-109]